MSDVLRLFDYDEAAAELRVSKTWLQRHIKRLPHSKKGRVVTFTAADLAAIDAMHHHDPQATAPVPAPSGGQPLSNLRPLPARAGRRTA